MANKVGKGSILTEEGRFCRNRAGGSKANPIRMSIGPGLLMVVDCSEESAKPDGVSFVSS
ncbi:MAG: hypothetical protein DMG06_20910 [Acidobacteria bacterium]|nr:MAG: hypothetical protein DMG06_20910 [Acidobacteriota bacterium]